MIDSRTLTPIGCLLVSAAMALAQIPAQAPPAPPAPRAPMTPRAAPAAPAVAPAVAPAPWPTPMPAPRALPIDPWDRDLIREMAQEDMQRALEMAQEAREQAAPMAFDAEQMRLMAEDARQQAAAAIANVPPLFQLKEGGGPLFQFKEGAGFGFGSGSGFGAGNLLAQARVAIGRGGQSDDRLYDAGQRSLESHRYDEALEYFNQVASHAGARADAAWYWKAYTLGKLNRRDEAMAALAELRKSYASSRWLDDAKALELEINQRAGRPVSPEAESDEELKLMAIGGIMQSDPDRAIPLLENILKSSQPPKVKERALFVLAQSSAPRAQQVIEQIARGGGNPDLQLKAINYLSQRRKQGSGNQNLLPEIYGSTTDVNVKRAILNAWRSSRDREHLVQMAKTEKVQELRLDAIRSLADNNPGQPDLWAIYQAESTPEMKQEILKCMYQDGNAEKLADVVRNEKDPKTRRVAIEVLASQKSAGAGDLLVAAYSSEQDPQNKQVIIDRLSNARTAKYLVDLARAEKDSKMKLRIVDRLSNMHSKEASDYLMELLSK